MKILRKEIISLVAINALLILALSTSGQENDSTSNFIDYSDKFGLYTYGITKFSKFEITDTLIKKKLTYENNGNLNIGLGFNYRWMGIALAFNFKFLNAGDVELYGRTNSLDLQIEALTRKFLVSGYLQAYKGYYWSNPNQLYPSWNKRDSVITMPELVTVNISMNGIYIFNYRQFSFKAVTTSTERQKESAGSCIAGFKTSLYGISNDSSLIPDILNSYYPIVSEFSGLSTLSIGCAFGYSYTFIFEDFFYVNLTAMVGLNLQGLSIKDHEGLEIKNVNSISSNGLLRLGFGCNKENVFYGITINADSYLINELLGAQISYSYGKMRLFYGRRFTLSEGTK